MKLFKMLGLGATAVIAAMAFVGVGTASAQHTGIWACKAYEPVLCKTSNLLDNVDLLLLGKSTNPKLLGTLTEKCNESNTSVFVPGSESMKNPVKGEVVALSFTGSCEPCPTVTTNGLPYPASLSMSEEGDKDYTLTSSGSATLSGCFIFFSCKFGGTGIELLVTNGESGPEVHAEKEALKYEGGSGEGICGSTGAWDADYTLTSVHLLELNNGVKKIIGTHNNVFLTLLELS